MRMRLFVCVYAAAHVNFVKQLQPFQLANGSQRLSNPI